MNNNLWIRMQSFANAEMINPKSAMHQSDSSTTKSNVRFVISNTKVVVRGSFLPLIKTLAIIGLIGSLVISLHGAANIYYTQLAHALILICLVILASTITQKSNPNPIKNKK